MCARERYFDQDTHSDSDFTRDRMQTSIELPSLRDHFKQDSLLPFSSPQPREVLPPILNHSPPGRSSTLPPLQRRDKNRPRKSSLGQAARKGKHERTRSKEHARRPSLGDRKAMSAEPQTAAWAQGKRWEDLIEAATSATEADDDRYSEVRTMDQGEREREACRTNYIPLSLLQVGGSPSVAPLHPTVPPAPSVTSNRLSLPPAFQSASGLPFPSPRRNLQRHSYAASPLHKSLTPPPPYELQRSRDSDVEPFPSIESVPSMSGRNFPPSSSPGLRPAAKLESSPGLGGFSRSSFAQRVGHSFSNPTPPSVRNNDVHVYCASCRRPWSLNDCYACTECISAVCRECVGMFVNSPPSSFATMSSANGYNDIPSSQGLRRSSYPNPRGCPRCHTVGGQWKAFQLDVR